MSRLLVSRRDGSLLALALGCWFVSYAARVEYVVSSVPSFVEWGMVLVPAVSLAVAFSGGRRGGRPWSSLAPTFGTGLGGTLGWQWVDAHDGFAVLPGMVGPKPWFVVGALHCLLGLVAFGVGRWVRRGTTGKAYTEQV